MAASDIVVSPIQRALCASLFAGPRHRDHVITATCPTIPDCYDMECTLGDDECVENMPDTERKQNPEDANGDQEQHDLNRKKGHVKGRQSSLVPVSATRTEGVESSAISYFETEVCYLRLYMYIYVGHGVLSLLYATR